MGTVCSSETLVSTYKSTLRCDPEDQYRHPQSMFSVSLRGKVSYPCKISKIMVLFILMHRFVDRKGKIEFVLNSGDETSTICCLLYHEQKGVSVISERSLRNVSYCDDFLNDIPLLLHVSLFPLVISFPWVSEICRFFCCLCEFSSVLCGILSTFCQPDNSPDC
jgi:hypothetical protein